MHRTSFQNVVDLLKPSWLSGLVAAVFTILLIGGGYIGTHLQGSVLQQALFTVRDSSATNYQQLTSKFSDNNFISNLPLLLFWIGVGFIVYYFAVAIYGAFQEAVEVEAELDYVNVQRQTLVRQAVLHFCVRLLALGLWFIYIGLYVKKLLPYVLASVHRLATSFTFHNLKDVLLVSLVLLIGTQLHTVFLRLIALRRRFFSSEVVA